MVCTYRVRTDTVHDEAREAHTIYGIEAIGDGGEILLSIPDVFFDRQRAVGFADRCNSGDCRSFIFGMPLRMLWRSQDNSVPVRMALPRMQGKCCPFTVRFDELVPNGSKFASGGLL